MKPNLAVAYGVKRKNMKSSGGVACMAKGGMAEEKMPMKSRFMDSHSLVKSMLAKKMAEGGMTEDEYHDEDFLSDEEDSPLLKESYPDEETLPEVETPEMNKEKRRAMLQKIMSKR